ncbi:hypothetical protein DTO195F2_5406 [Paecilomyces variotii]|nr:hypothetical protein DTO195F2_5406 [Paecilomyces variotii]KAJ9385775.1 hypothetical protein DTO063F5_3982 [Paecilomyces variotii]
MSQLELDLLRAERLAHRSHWTFGRTPDTCVFCFERLEADSPYRQLPCEHCFHLPCIDNWIGRHHANCPLCRESFYYFRRPRIVTITRPQPAPSQSTDWPGEKQKKLTGGLEDSRPIQAVFSGLKTWCKKKIQDRASGGILSPARRTPQKLLMRVNPTEGIPEITH